MKRSKYLPRNKKKGYNSLIRVNSSIKTYHSRIIWTQSNPFMIQDNAGLRLNTMLHLFLLKHNSWWFLYHFYLGHWFFGEFRGIQISNLKAAWHLYKSYVHNNKAEKWKLTFSSVCKCRWQFSLWRKKVTECWEFVNLGWSKSEEEKKIENPSIRRWRQNYPPRRFDSVLDWS